MFKPLLFAVCNSYDDANENRAQRNSINTEFYDTWYYLLHCKTYLWFMYEYVVTFNTQVLKAFIMEVKQDLMQEMI